MTPERLAALEAEANKASDGGSDVLRIDEDVSPVTGRRFTRA